MLEKPSMAAVSSEVDSWTSAAIQDEGLGNSECPSDDEFVHIQMSSSQKGTAMAALSSIIHLDKAIDGDWVALSSPAMKVQTLEVSNLSPDSADESAANTEIRAFAVSETISYKNLRTTSEDPALDIDPAKRETYLSDKEFESLFGMSKSQFYALPQWKQAQRKLDLDLF
jgi:gelsolin